MEEDKNKKVFSLNTNNIRKNNIIDHDKLNSVVDRLVKVYAPNEIYLFGSFAWGNPEEDSDLDLLVIVDHSEEKIYKRPIKGIKALRGLKLAKDVIVYTNDEFNNLSSNEVSLFDKIKREGIKLYGAT